LAKFALSLKSYHPLDYFIHCFRKNIGEKINKNPIFADPTSVENVEKLPQILFYQS